MTHDLKTWPEYFNDVILGIKTFEVRRNDRDFKIGDYVILHEWSPEAKEYTGRKSGRQIVYILQGGQFGIEEGFIVMSIR